MQQESSRAGPGGRTFSGRARVDSRTKDLVKRLHYGEVAVVDHADLDETAARALVKAGAAAVVNRKPFVTGRFPTPGPGILVEAGVMMVESGEDLDVEEGDLLSYDGISLYRNGQVSGIGTVLTPEELGERLEASEVHLQEELSRFVGNTLAYAEAEKDQILAPLALPPIAHAIRGRPVLVVVRGHNHSEDLQAIRGYVRDVRPVLIGVDGGADALLDFGLQPDIIVGDLDSVSDVALESGAEIIVHAYPDGRAPGLIRARDRGLEVKVLPAAGTSEDVALLLAYEKGAALIVAVGTHLGMLEFLEKGREGMASTLLTRIKVGSILVDAKGVSRLYRSGLKWGQLAVLALAGVATMVLIFLSAPNTQNYARLIWLKFRYTFGF